MKVVLMFVLQVVPLVEAKPLAPVKPEKVHPRLSVNQEHRSVKAPASKPVRKPASVFYKPSLIDE
jgi:hypothetical protein